MLCGMLAGIELDKISELRRITDDHERIVTITMIASARSCRLMAFWLCSIRLEGLCVSTLSV